MTNLKRKSLTSDVHLTSMGMYKEFVADTGRSDISFDLYKQSIFKVNEKIMEKVTTGRYSVRFPKLGKLAMISVIPTKLIRKIDWGRYHKDGVYTTFKNHHSDGLMYRVFFYLYEKKVPQFGFYNFKLSRNHQVALSVKILNNEIR